MPARPLPAAAHTLNIVGVITVGLEQPDASGPRRSGRCPARKRCENRCRSIRPTVREEPPRGTGRSPPPCSLVQPRMRTRKIAQTLDIHHRQLRLHRRLRVRRKKIPRLGRMPVRPQRDMQRLFHRRRRPVTSSTSRLSYVPATVRPFARANFSPPRNPVPSGRNGRRTPPASKYWRKFGLGGS